MVNKTTCTCSMASIWWSHRSKCYTLSLWSFTSHNSYAHNLWYI